MKSGEKLRLRVAVLFVILLFSLFQPAAAQSVYVGKAGSEGKVLRKYTEPSALKKLVDQPTDSIWIIDVRSEKAYANGHIPTAKSFPSGTILNRLNEIPKDQYLILYCTVGGLAKITAQKLKKSGYKRYMVWGGISRWEWERETK
ncbi:MAG: rhodanese-like domain-containing protein [Prolixibacteraceae bacterium]|jgi:rhodanese-related sulfurtransferase